jgi:hypothetical protein
MRYRLALVPGLSELYQERISRTLSLMSASTVVV